jgi:hypothetical protein
MPQYEYMCEADGEVITLLRAMRDADAPVADPLGKGRVFVRRHSTFGVAGGAKTVSLPTGGGCACGRPHGSCGSH